MKRGARGLRLGRYLLGERLATGGMGEVFSAVQQGLGAFEKPVALKLLLPHLSRDERGVRMFLDEARLAAQMNHRNIVQIFDVGEDAGRHFIAMELVRGVNLSRLIAKLAESGRQLPPPVLAFIASTLCDALHAAHELSDSTGQPLHIVHRDVSPHNVLVSVQGEVKLTDFGIAKTRDTLRNTQTGTVKGKYEYLAPEQFSGKAVDRRADVFAAGVTLYHLATGISPFRRDSEAATMHAVCMEDVLPLHTLRPDLPPAFSSAVHAAIEKVPTQRLPSARALKEALPPSGEGGAVSEALGALVWEYCQKEVHELDERAGTGHGTLPVPSTSGLSSKPPRSKRRWPWVLASLTVASVGVLTWALSTRAEAPAPSRTVALPASPPSLALTPSVQSHSGEVTLLHRVPSPPVRLPARKVARQGFLTVDAVPWASVSIQGKAVGDTPLHRLPVVEGTVRVRLKNPDTGKTRDQVVRIEAGREARLRIDLR